jgi:hypothetical protein
MEDILDAYHALPPKHNPHGRIMSQSGNPVSLRTAGNSIVDQDGRQFYFKGVSKSGLEYLTVDFNVWTPEMMGIDFSVMKEWGVTALRIPLRDVAWLNNDAYRLLLDKLILHALQNAIIVILDLHTQQQDQGLAEFMKKNQPNDALAFWSKLSQKYGDIPVILFEVFNEPHNIDPMTWWYGDNTYYGYHDVLVEIRRHSNNICIIGGLDYAYQWAFIHNYPDILHEMHTTVNLAIATHPYGYRGLPSGDERYTQEIPHSVKFPAANEKHVGDCSLGITVPGVSYAQYGWAESFGFMADTFPLIVTEFGLDRPDNALQGGWYSQGLIQYMNARNISYCAWAFIQDRLDYPSLLGQGLQPTGEALYNVRGPPCGMSENGFYAGPGKLVKHDMGIHKPLGSFMFLWVVFRSSRLSALVGNFIDWFILHGPSLRTVNSSGKLHRMR